MSEVAARERSVGIRCGSRPRHAVQRRAILALVAVASLAVGGCASSSGPAPRTAVRGSAGPDPESPEISGAESSTPRPPALSSGSAALGRADYGWTLLTLAGERIDLGAYRGRVLFINMWATWCPPCVAELASIGRLRDSLRTTDTAFLLVSPEQPEPVAKFMKRYRYDLPVFVEGTPMPDAFDLRALPTTYIVDRAGNIVVRHRGAADWDREPVRELLRSL